MGYVSEPNVNYVNQAVPSKKPEPRNFEKIAEALKSLQKTIIELELFIDDLVGKREGKRAPMPAGIPNIPISFEVFMKNAPAKILSLQDKINACTIKLKEMI